MSRPSDPAGGPADRADVVVTDPGVLRPEDAAALADVLAGHVAAGRGGMAFSLFRAGQPVLDVCGGPAPTALGSAWTPDTLAVLFSGTKGAVSTVLAGLADDGVLDVDAPVAELWPEFAAAGKQDVRVHHVLSHSVGLLYVDPEPEAVDDLRAEADALAAQPTLWEPGTRVAYHAVTWGILVAELVRRAAGRTVGELVAQRLAEPFGLDLHLGLPESEEPRVAAISREPDYRIATFLKDDPERRALVDRMYGSRITGEDLPANSRAYRAAGHPSGGAVGTASAMARLYSLVAGTQEVVSAPVRERFTRCWAEGRDAVNDRPVRFGLGYELDDPIGTYGPERPAFGHSGAGGGLHGAWPDLGAGFSFLPGRMCSEDTDTRAKDLLAVASRALRNID